MKMVNLKCFKKMSIAPQVIHFGLFHSQVGLVGEGGGCSPTIEVGDTDL